MNNQCPQEVIDFVRSNKTMSLGTVGTEGTPQVADVYYAAGSEMRLYFVSSPHSRHVANIQRMDGRVAASIHAPGTDWRNIRGVQMEGLCTRLTGAESAVAYARYVAAFPYVLTDPTLLSAFGKVVLFQLTPSWVRWIDNAHDLGRNQEFNL